MVVEIIIAGNYKKFEQYLYENNKIRKECHYIANDRDLIGLDLKNIKIIFYGTYYKRKDLYEIEGIIYKRGKNDRSV